MDPKDYPLKLTKDIAAAYSWCRQVLTDESELLEATDVEKHMIHLIRIGHPNFYFKVFAPHLEQGLYPTYQLRFSPENENTFSSILYNLSLDAIKQKFDLWIGLVKAYEPISFSQNEEFLKIYEAEYYQTFAFTDEELKNTPFNYPTQLLLSYCLEGVSSGLKLADHHDPEIKTLLEETMAIKDNIQNLTRESLAKRISKLMARIRKKSIPLFQSIGEEIKKQLIKEGIELIFKGIGHLISQHS